MWRALIFIILLTTRAEAAGPQPCYFSGSFTKCFTTSGILVPQISWTDTTKGIVGTTTNDNASAGYVGQVLSSIIGAGTSVGTSGQYFDTTSITLTAGDWNVSGQILYSRNGATFTSTDLEIALSGASGNSSTGFINGFNSVFAIASVPVTFTFFPMTIGPIRVQSDGTNLYIGSSTYSSVQVLYLKGFAGSYSAATPQFYANIIARRAR